MEQLSGQRSNNWSWDRKLLGILKKKKGRGRKEERKKKKEGRRWKEEKERKSLLLHTYGPLSFFFSPFLFRLLLLTHFRESPVREHYFGITRRYMQKKIIFLLVNFYFFMKKADFWAFFLLFIASVWSRPPGPLQSLEYSLRLLLLTHLVESPPIFWHN